MRIAFLNPWRYAAENQGFWSLVLAGRRIGHELVQCANSDEVEAAAPDFVLSVHDSQPKLTKFPTYGVIHQPRHAFLANKERFHNLLTYDGYLTISDSLVKFLTNVLYGIGRRVEIGYYYNTCQKNFSDPEFKSRLQSGNVKLTYFGTNWDQRRSRFFRWLSNRDDVAIYGPEEAWPAINRQAYNGVLPFDGVSVQAKYRENGVGLVLLSDNHLADDIISNRIFEIASVGAVAICCRTPWLEHHFEDSVYYFDQHASDAQMLRQIGKTLDNIRAHPDDAFARAQRAKLIFEEKFCAEKLLQNVVEYHTSVSHEYSRAVGGGASGRRAEPLISVVIRCGGRPLEVLRRALKSVAEQTFGRYEVILVRYKLQDLGPLVSEFSALVESLVVIDCLGGNRSKTLWCGLQHVNGEYFAVLDDDDEWMPNHFRELFAVAGEFTPTEYFAYTGGIHVWLNPRQTVRDYVRERRFIFCFGIEQAGSFFDQASHMLTNGFVASSSLLDKRLLQDPQMTTSGEDTYLILSLLSKTRARFNFRATALHYESTDGTDFGKYPNRHEDVLTWRLRLGSASLQPPQPVDFHDFIRALDGDITPSKPRAEDTQEGDTLITQEGETLIYHAGDFPLSWDDRAALSNVPFDLDTQDLVAGGVKATDCLLLDAGRAALSITPPRVPWHYAAQLRFKLNGASNATHLLAIDCTVTKGTVGFSLLNKSEDKFLYRIAVPASTKKAVVLIPIERAQAIGRLIVQNWGSGGEVHVDIHGITLWK